MRPATFIGLFVITFSMFASPALAWWDEGHMQIAYVAYKHLDEAVREKADASLKLNKDYPKWTAAAPDDKPRSSTPLSMPQPGQTISRRRNTAIHATP